MNELPRRVWGYVLSYNRIELCVITLFGDLWAVTVECGGSIGRSAFRVGGVSTARETRLETTPRSPINLVLSKFDSVLLSEGPQVCALKGLRARFGLPCGPLHQLSWCMLGLTSRHP